MAITRVSTMMSSLETDESTATSSMPGLRRSWPISEDRRPPDKVKPGHPRAAGLCRLWNYFPKAAVYWSFMAGVSWPLTRSKVAPSKWCHSVPKAGPIFFSTPRMYSDRVLASSSLANTSTTAPPSVPVSPALAPESVIHASEVYWPGRPRSLFESSSSVTVVTAVMVATLAFSAVATDVASAATVGVGVGVGVLAAVVAAAAGADDVVGVAWAEQPVKRTVATPRTARCLRMDLILGSESRVPLHDLRSDPVQLFGSRRTIAVRTGWMRPLELDQPDFRVRLRLLDRGLEDAEDAG